MAQSSDMSLGAGGFGAGYTPITFAPLVSLTGPVQAQAPAAPTAEAPAAVAPIRYSTMADMPDNAYMTGEMQQGTPGAGFVNPFAGMSGAQIGQKALDAASFFTSPLGFAAQYAMTGKTPSEHMQGITSGSNPFAGFLQGLQALFGGGQQQPQVPIGPQMLSEKAQGGVASIGGIGGATYNDALNIASGWGLSSEAANAAGTAAAALVAQGVDPSMAISLALMDASMAASQVPEGAPTPGGSPAPGGPAFTGIEAMPMDIFGNPYSPVAASYPVGSQPAATVGLGVRGPIATTTSYGGSGAADMPKDVSFTGGGWAPGDTLGGYDTNTGAYSDITGYE